MKVVDSFLKIAVMLFALLASSSLLAAQNNNYESNTMPGGGEDTLHVDVDGTTATDYKVLVSHDGGATWDPTPIAEGTVPGQGTFAISLDNELVVGKTYKVKGKTAAQSGPYDAELTAT